jgi:UPF0716 protein FxsA
MRWIFLLLPWVELYTLIQLGSRIGALATLAYVFVTLVLGLTILRLQGMEIITRLQEAQRSGFVAGRLLADDIAVGLAGILLLIPGLVTDCFAAAVLVGPLWRRLLRRVGHSPGGGDGAYGQDSYSRRDHRMGGPGPGPDNTGASGGMGRPDDPIEGEFRRVDDD